MIPIRSSTSRKVIGKILLPAFVLLALFSFSPVASAHAALVSSSPEADSVLQEFPTEITLEFNEPLLVIEGSSANWFTLTSPSGEVVPMGEPTLDGARIISPLTTSEMEQGRYRVEYRVVSSDGHVIKGEFGFTFKGGQTDGGESSQVVDRAPSEDEPHPGVLGIYIAIAIAVITAVVLLKFSGTKGSS